MAFNGVMKRQERLSKDDVDLLYKALKHLQYTHKDYSTSHSIIYLAQKLERMEKAFR